MKQIEKPEEAFQCELLDRLEKASSIAGVRPAAFLQKVQKRGAVPVMRELLRRGQESDLFEPLCRAGRLDLSPEELVTGKKYAGLFSDEEVNACFLRLCENGYYDG